MQETWVQSLNREDPLEKEMAIHSSILAWEIPWTEELGGLQSIGWQRIGHDLVTKQQQYLLWRTVFSICCPSKKLGYLSFFTIELLQFFIYCRYHLLTIYIICKFVSHSVDCQQL